MAFFEGCCPLNWGGVSTGAGLVDGGVDQGPCRERGQGCGVGGVPTSGAPRAPGKGLAWRGKGSVPGGVGGRGTGPRDGANFATCVVFLGSRDGCVVLTRTKKGCPVGWGGYPPELDQWPCVVFLSFLTVQKEEKWRFLKDALSGGGGTHRSWPGGRGGGEEGVTEQISQRVSYFLSFLTRTKRSKMAFFEGCPVGWGGYSPELAWSTGR